MSSSLNPALFPQLWDRLRADFLRLRTDALPIRARLIQRGVEARAGQMGPVPPWLGVAFAGCGGAGERDPLFVPHPAGAAIILPAETFGLADTDAYPWETATEAGRIVEFGVLGSLPATECQYHQRLRLLAADAGTLVSRSVPRGCPPALAEWCFRGPEGLWWALVFELAWAGRHPLLRAEKWTWLAAGGIFPYDLEQIRQLARAFSDRFPEQWLERLPDTYFSEIDDVASACVHAVDVLTGTTSADGGAGVSANSHEESTGGRAGGDSGLADHGHADASKTKSKPKRKRGGRPKVTTDEAEKRWTFYREVLERRRDKGEPMKTVAEDWNIETSEGRAWMEWCRENPQKAPENRRR